VMVKGISCTPTCKAQATDTWVTVEAGAVIAHQPEEFGARGDGTVPRLSAHPPEWDDDTNATFLHSKHSSLQGERATITQLQGILSAPHKPRPPMAVEDEIAVDALPFAVANCDWIVTAQSVEGSDRLVLIVTVESNDPDRNTRCIAPRQLRPQGNGRFRATIRLPEPGSSDGLFTPIPPRPPRSTRSQTSSCA